MNKKQIAFDLIDQIIALSNAQDREFTKLVEKFNTNSIYNKVIVPNGECSTTFHIKQLKELLEEIFKEELPQYEKPIWSNIAYSD